MHEQANEVPYVPPCRACADTRTPAPGLERLSRAATQSGTWPCLERRTVAPACWTWRSALAPSWCALPRSLVSGTSCRSSWSCPDSACPSTWVITTTIHTHATLRSLQSTLTSANTTRLISKHANPLTIPRCRRVQTVYFRPIRPWMHTPPSL